MEFSNARSSVVDASHARYPEPRPDSLSGANLFAARVPLAGAVALEESKAAGEVGIVQESSPRAEDPDRDIVHLLETGDRSAALGILMRRHGTAVYRYCREAVRDSTLAEDVQQQIFLQVYRDFARFGGRATLRTWLFAIARNRVLDAIRSHRRARVHIEDCDAGHVPDPGPEPGERIDDIRLHHALAVCFGQLGEHMRTAVLLHYQQGFTFEDMAEICGEKPGTLQARVMRTLPRLRACIEARTGGRL
jgi:RNA polymerase sigma-70 factor (ECF subfamily)